MKEISEILEEMTGPHKSVVKFMYDHVREEFDNKPAAVKHHHSEKGGMGRHVKEVMNIALDTYDKHPDWYGVERDEVIIASLIHDFSKLGRYREIPLGDWRRQEKYGSQRFEYDKEKTYVNETAEVVLLCAQAGLQLSREVVNAVTFHHGFVSESAKDNSSAMSQMTAFSVLLHFADMMSCKVYDKGVK